VEPHGAKTHDTETQNQDTRILGQFAENEVDTEIDCSIQATPVITECPSASVISSALWPIEAVSYFPRTWNSTNIPEWGCPTNFLGTFTSR
jgi:hypothetical protein